MPKTNTSFTARTIVSAPIPLALAEKLRRQAETDGRSLAGQIRFVLALWAEGRR